MGFWTVSWALVMVAAEVRTREMMAVTFMFFFAYVIEGVF